jgi:hypothetical protein
LKATIYPISAAAPNRIAIVARPRGGDWLCEEVSALTSAANGKWLTRRSTKHSFDPSFVLFEVVFANVALDNVPLPHMLNPLSFVMTKSFACISVPFKDRGVVKSRSCRAKRQPASANEKLE